ncbi:hypothetical protein V2J09_008255 [Rumex salicifolius]
MEMEDSKMMNSCQKDELVVNEEPENRLPGFRFHPTDEELVSFYLKRKVEKRPISIEIIKQIDIYKHDPWELAKLSSVGDKEWYFYCKRERKYRNSVRPNRVTGSGFWKATGIDKPVYSNGGEGHQCVGLKKSLVYYRGIAGKGSKTEWMMHEFRLPTDHSSGDNPRDNLQQAEVWTLCRILRRNRKYSPDWRELSAKRSSNNTTNSNPCSRTDESINNRECYINFADATTQRNYYEAKSEVDVNMNNMITSNILGPSSVARTSVTDSSPLNPSSSVEDHQSDGQFIAAYDGNWDDLSSVVEYAIRSPFL